MSETTRAKAPRPHGNTVIWRYLTLDKFLDILLNHRLHFSSAATLTDKYEARPPLSDVRLAFERVKEQATSVVEAADNAMAYFDQLVDLRERTVVTSWSAGPGESYALWKIYLQGGRTGVAIRTTVSRLERAVHTDPYGREIRIRTVRYSDRLEDENPEWDDVVTRKAPHYDYEREIRCYFVTAPKAATDRSKTDLSGRSPAALLTAQPARDHSGVYVSVDIQELLQEIYVSPFAGRWYGQLLRDLVTRLAPGLQERIKSSVVMDV